MEEPRRLFIDTDGDFFTSTTNEENDYDIETWYTAFTTHILSNLPDRWDTVKY